MHVIIKTLGAGRFSPHNRKECFRHIKCPKEYAKRTILTKTLRHLLAYPEPVFVWDQHNSTQEHCRQSTKAYCSAVAFYSTMRSELDSITS